MKTPRRLAAALDPETVRVAVVLPLRNEGDHLEQTLESVLKQTFPSERIEILAVDGKSTDGTLEILKRYQEDHPNIRILANPGRYAASGLNVGVKNSTAEVVLRVDGHCNLAEDYMQGCVDLLIETRAGNVGGLVRAKGDGITGSAVGSMMRSRFGMGNGHFHYMEKRAYVDTVFLGAFPRNVLEEVGGYDEDLQHNQDDELNYRIRMAGYGVLLSPDIISTYAPRESFRKLARQFYRYGYWKVRVIEKHPGSIQLRHLVPPAFVLGSLLSLLACIGRREKRFLFPLALYACLNLGATASRSRTSPRPAPSLAVVFPTIHMSYGLGFLMGLARPACRLLISAGKGSARPSSTDD